MTIQEIRDRIEDIRARADDDEVAHSMEDELRADVLNAIALGEFVGADAVRAAAIALTTSEISFSRWFA